MQSWDEMAKFSKKRCKVFKAISIAVEEDKRALSSMMRMKKLRDTLAHGKPAEFKTEQEKECTREELMKGSVLAGMDRSCRRPRHKGQNAKNSLGAKLVGYALVSGLR
ncbi:hypothetical protein [Bradyrhizobium sp. WSM3983]|uniref:hypothetical protein n=1 Tax=Bradyrhizobium sp. WSM3983 TaxID=1038867 RepID=UPI0004850622|nr:hypothetical protein [Bradyrhizobium sp. WSM3983]